MGKVIKCGICGQRMEVHYSDEGTGCYIPREAEELRARLEVAVKALRECEPMLSSLLAECLYHREEVRRRGHYSDALRLSDIQFAKTSIRAMRAIVEDASIQITEKSEGADT